MTRLPIGLIVLIIVSILIYFGLAQRVLDRLRLSDRAAFVIIAALIVGSFIDLPVTAGRYDVSVNVGGGLVPIVVAGYLLAKAGTAMERIRAVIATLLTAGVIYGAGFLLGTPGAEPGGRMFGFLDSIWAYPLVAGTIAYAAGRSRRSAFIAATLGLVLVDIAYLVWLVNRGAPAGTVAIGGAGAFDAIVLAGITAVLLAEIIGEVRERLHGGPAADRPQPLLEGLKKPELEGQENDREEKNEGGGRS